MPSSLPTVCDRVVFQAWVDPKSTTKKEFWLNKLISVGLVV